MTIRPDASFLEWLALQRAAQRTASKEAVAAMAEWARLNAEFMDKAKRQRWPEYQIGQMKAINLGLNDAYTLYMFKKGEVERISADIQGELARFQLLALAADPTGMTYSRDDDDDAPPAEPVPAHVEGHRLGGRSTDRPHPRAGEADARLDTAGRGSAAVREAPTGVGAPVGAGDSSPTGRAVNERRPHPSPGQSGVSRSAVGLGRATAGRGAAGAGVPAAPNPGGAPC